MNTPPVTVTVTGPCPKPLLMTSSTVPSLFFSRA